jgi:hypothetical protein
MWLPDDRWTTLLAFVVGAAESSPEAPLAGFQRWATSHLGEPDTSIVWYSVLFESLGGRTGSWPRGYDAPSDANSRMCEAICDLVLQYVGPSEPHGSATKESPGPPA